jgi:ParB-like chromosome segregation protein Spo0J
MQVVLLPVESILADPALQSRAQMNEQCVEEYAESVKAGALFPPVTVFSDGERYWLADGFHRLRAHIIAGHRSIRAVIRFGTRRDAIRHAAGCNAAHGLQRNNRDKRRAVTMMLQDAKLA